MTRFNPIPALLFTFTIGLVSCSANTKNAVRSTNHDTAYISSTKILKSNFIPDSVFEMTQLKTLQIAGDDCDNGIANCWMIQTIPPAIGKLVHLDTLSLTLGVFEKFPDEITALQQLRFLNLTDSRMTDIANIMQLKNLEQLLLFGCGLNKLPADIGNLNHLKFIGLVGNQLDSAEIARIKKALPNCNVYFH